MIKIQESVLVTRNARDKIQVARYILWQDTNSFIIKRYTGQFGGKVTEQPEVVIEKGKVKRTVIQQAELEYNSLVKKSLDKGYKKLSDLTKTKYDDITEEELNKVVPSIKTDSYGFIKPQLAKSSKDCTPNVWDKPLWCSRKLDGVRCLMKWDSEAEEIKSISRGGENYDVATTHIRNSPELISLFKEYPELILDGELYIHGWPLQKISGTCRLETWEERCENIEYWVYDIADTEKIFSQRLDVILFKITDFIKEDSKVKLVEHKLLESYSTIKKYHDKWVSEGFEGLVARKPDKKYQPGKRPSDWIKLKEYSEDTFLITGYKLGLRGSEDMCFTLKTKDGKEFDAKPIGDREQKQWYVDNINDCIGKLGEVKYFAYSLDGKPMQPSFRAVRYDLK